MTDSDGWAGERLYDAAPPDSPPQATWLPAGAGYVPLRNLEYMLARSAQSHAQRAISLFVSSDMDELLLAAISAGTAAELLSKAYLATLNRSLLADKGHANTVLLLGGHGAMAKADIYSVRTISGLDAMKFVERLNPSFPRLAQQPRILSVRNIAAHLAMVDRSELRLAVVEMIQITEAILPSLKLARPQFWRGHAIAVVNSLLDQARTDLQKTIDAKMAAARERLRVLVADLASDAVATVITAISTRIPSDGEHIAPQACPSCGNRGWLICHVLEGEVVIDDDSGNAASEWTEPIAFPYWFECSVCQLELNSGELAAFDFPKSIDLDIEDSYPESSGDG